MTLRKSTKALVIIAGAQVVSSCGTQAYLKTVYSGYRVMDKGSSVQTKWITTSRGACVAPNGAIVIEERSEDEQFAGLCTPPLHFILRDGPQKQISYTVYVLSLESPDGKRTEFKTSNPDQYNSYNVGDLIGK